MINLVIDEIIVYRKIDHPNIAKMYNLLKDENGFHIVMEFIEGFPLSNLPKNVNKQNINNQLISKICYQVLLALNYMSSQHNIAHRDIKPDNIMLQKEGKD